VYQLLHATETGPYRRSDPVPTVDQVTDLTVSVLMIGGRIPRPEALRFARALVRKPVGSEWTHLRTGYRFRITEY
jgi:hypothetical protein